MEGKGTPGLCVHGGLDRLPVDPPADPPSRLWIEVMLPPFGRSGSAMQGQKLGCRSLRNWVKIPLASLVV